jgi:hypothetical protein
MRVLAVLFIALQKSQSNRRSVTEKVCDYGIFRAKGEAAVWVELSVSEQASV